MADLLELAFIIQLNTEISLQQTRHFARARAAGGGYRELWNSYSNLQQLIQMRMAMIAADGGGRVNYKPVAPYQMRDESASEDESSEVPTEESSTEEESTEEDEPAPPPPPPPPPRKTEAQEQEERLAKLRRTMSAWRKGRRVCDFAEPPLDWVPPPPRPRHSLPARANPSASSSSNARPPLKPLAVPSVFNPKPGPIPLDSSDEEGPTPSARKRSRKLKGKQREGRTVISSGGGKKGDFIKKLRRISREGARGEDD